MSLGLATLARYKLMVFLTVAHAHQHGHASRVFRLEQQMLKARCTELLDVLDAKNTDRLETRAIRL